MPAYLSPATSYIRQRKTTTEDNNTVRADALRRSLKTLRATLESKPVKKRPVPSPRTWPDYPSNRYHLNDIMERDTKSVLLEAFKNAHIAGLDESWRFTWFQKIEQICLHETQATVDPAFRKLTKGQTRNMQVSITEEMT
ncbi:hypothetical protein SARC_04635 [Sphaeroforma arctica JP610]|uniref:Uncharacterized protein n=1 Tax=Sphaeroforma arctica JP610 TaxID=667725 RepID=A0A0L0G1U8_9EUKA|nr:hypothetical protein SARC_04635 [Sphaeroforma arctica JP610]KNC83097.1 hypothetical protein SARC_04635 [Sphaeroforma arctica JP610]|eukprot:XP_014156999.1 hypothetical protein SARC_04635 [Sphaeroforma arctica JP610]